MLPLSDLPLRVLRVVAQRLGISNRAKLRKTELVDVISQSGTGRVTKAVNETLSEDYKEPSALQPKEQISSVSVALEQASSSKPVQTSAPVIGPHGHPGLPVPQSYGRDQMTLMVQDPHHLHAYWEVTPATLAKARAELGEDGLPVLIVHSRFGAEFRIIDLKVGSYYLCVSADTTYRADLGLRGHNGRVVIIAQSQTVHSPSDQISSRSDEQWMGVDTRFHEFLHMAGLDKGTLSSADLASQRGEWKERVLSRQDLFNLPSSASVPPGALYSSLDLLSSKNLSSDALPKNQ